MAKATYGAIPAKGRVTRSPQHRFYLEHMPFQIQPFMLAPVIPAETLKNANLQARVVTDPILNKLVGWWIEYYFFYVKLRDLDDREDFTGFLTDLSYDLSAHESAASVAYNHGAGGINWAALCTKRIVETYFRDEGEAWDDFLINSMPCAAINVNGFIQSAGLNDVYAVDDPVIATETAGTLDNTVITASEVDAALTTWQFQRAHNMTDMTYEDWLRSYGIATPREQLHRPELLRYLREWSYPANTVDPTDGSASSAVSWAIRDRIDKDRFFREPGFIVGLTVARPKVYLKNVDGSAADYMRNAVQWLPALLRDDPWTSLAHYAHDDGPLQTVVTDTDGYWVDIKDLLLYGDDFVNVARSGTGLNMVSLPSADLANKHYPTDADVDGLFTGSADTARQVRQDGIVTLDILGTQTDTTPAASRNE